jgi:hypothetical protein
MTTTATGYDTGSGFIVNGTIVETWDALNYYVNTYNLNVNCASSPVKTITGGFEGPAGATGGTLYFNGTGYTYAELGL